MDFASIPHLMTEPKSQESWLRAPCLSTWRYRQEAEMRVSTQVKGHWTPQGTRGNKTALGESTHSLMLRELITVSGTAPSVPQHPLVVGLKIGCLVIHRRLSKDFTGD